MLLHTHKTTCWGTPRAGRSALFTFTATSTPRNPPEPAMTSFDQASSSKRRLSASCGQMCGPHTQRSWAQFINPLLPVLTASSLLTNASLDRCSLTQFRGREVTGHLLNDTRSMKCHHPQTKEADRPLPKSSFSFPSNTRLMKSDCCTSRYKATQEEMHFHPPSTEVKYGCGLPKPFPF